MKSSVSLFLSLLLCGHGLAEEPPKKPANPEIQKIDARLEELKVIWHQENDVINGYTKNRTVPVREGSSDYHACLKAANRLKQAEAEASQLKQKRKQLVDGTVTGDGVGENSIGAYQENEDYAVVLKDIPVVVYNSEQHGPKVKDLFIGMSMTDFAAKAEKLAGIKYRASVAKRDTKLVIAVMKTGVPPMLPIPKGTHLILPAEYGLGVMTNEGIMGLANEEGKVKGVVISGAVAKVLFKSNNLSLSDFAKTFSDAYGVSLEVNLDRVPIEYKGLSKQGVVVVIQSDFGVTLTQGNKPDDTKKAFD